MPLLGSEFYPRGGIHLLAIVFGFGCKFGRRCSGVIYGLHFGQFFLHNRNTRKLFENNTLKTLWKSRAENNGGKRAGVLPVALWHTQRFFQITAEVKRMVAFKFL